MNPRTFNAICILAIVAVGAAAMFMVHASSGSQTMDRQADAAVQEVSSNPMAIHPLELGLALAVVADLGLMTLGLVILFKDDTPGHDRYL